jgi:hypothetical protein
MISRVRVAATAVLALLAILALVPSGVLADCNGPACGPPDTGVQGIQAIALVAILVGFTAVMAAQELRRR